LDGFSETLWVGKINKVVESFLDSNLPSHLPGYR
jgi:hypothetical protein